MKEIKNLTMDEERALYHLQDAVVTECVFEGPADGESALKESENIDVENCRFSLRYPLWHSKHFTLKDSSMDINARAALWYAGDGKIIGTKLEGPKCLRECDNITLDNVQAVSPEFGWKCRGIEINASSITSEYFMLDSRDIHIDGLKMKGKYSFQYTENVRVSNSDLDTKDAFWHSRNAVVENCTIKGEYLAWYSNGLTLINCRIIGTQPLCYCKNLKLINCTMEGTDLSFEYSDVQADVKGNILSVKNPRSGHITADSIGEIINEGAVMETSCIINVR